MRTKRISKLFGILCAFAAALCLFFVGSPQRANALYVADAVTDSVVNNGDLETGLENWIAEDGTTIADHTASPLSGSHALALIAGNDGESRTVYQNITVRANTRYVLTFHAKKTANFNSLTVGIRKTAVTIYEMPYSGLQAVTDSGYSRFQTVAETNAETSVQLYFTAASFNDPESVPNDCSVLFDDITMAEESRVLPSTNLLNNPGFETEGQNFGWEKSDNAFQNTGEIHRQSGNRHVAIFCAAATPVNTGFLTQSVPVKSDTRYALIVNTKRWGAEAAKIRVGFRDADKNVLKSNEYAAFTPINRYYTLSCVYTTGENETTLLPYVQLEGDATGEAGVHVDDLYLYEVPCDDPENIPNLIMDGNFEQTQKNGDTVTNKNWSLIPGSTAGFEESAARAFDGEYSVFAYHNAASSTPVSGMSQTVSVEKNTDYVLSLRVIRREYSEAGIGARVINAEQNSLAERFLFIKDLEATYERLVIKFNSGDNTSVSVEVGCTKEGYRAWGGMIDNVILTQDNVPVQLIAGLSGNAAVKIGAAVQVAAPQVKMVDGSTKAASSPSYSSSNTVVATVSDSGLINGVSTGQAVITVSANGLAADISVLITPETLTHTDYLTISDTLPVEFSPAEGIGLTYIMKLTALPEKITLKTVLEKVKPAANYTLRILKNGTIVTDVANTYASNDTTVELVASNGIVLASYNVAVEYKPETAVPGEDEKTPVNILVITLIVVFSVLLAVALAFIVIYIVRKRKIT